MKKTFLLVWTAFVLVTPSFGVQEYYDLSKSVRSLGMGGAFYGLSDDEYALFSNPAGLSLRRTGSELMLRVNGHVSSDAISGFSDFTNISGGGLETAIKRLDKYKGKPLYGNVGVLPYFVSKNLAVGLLLADTKVNFNISKGSSEITGSMDPSTEVADLTFLSDSGVVLGYAQSVGDPDLHIGINLKGLLRAGGRKSFTASEYLINKKIDFDPKQIGGSGMGVDLDLGATYEMKNLPFGLLSRASLVLSNLLASEFSISHNYGPVPRLNRTANLGWYTAFDGFAFVDNVHVLLDINNISLGGETNPDLGARTGSFMKKVHLGVELPIGRFSLRGGLNQGYLTAGFGMNLYAIRLDVATYGEETGESTKQQSRRYALTAALGWGSAPPAPIPVTPEERKSVVPIQVPVKDEPLKKEPIKTEPAKSEPATSETVQPKN
ncbi:MAG: hypothetical protein ACKN9V_04565 [Pseudomonadota bacterium]